MASTSSAPPTPTSAAATADQQRYENPINLKVMRLCKPGFFFRLPVPFQPGEQGASSLCEEDYGLSGTLTLPQSFGDIYLGETFSCYISLCNSAPIQLSSVGLKVEVQTQLTRETLSDSSTPEASIASFAPQQTLDRIIRYELKDVGIHILICSALYVDASGEKKYFRKFFKFQVQNPLSMKSKTHALAPLNEILVETQIQNSTARVLFLQSVGFTPSADFEAVPLTHFESKAMSAPRLAGSPGTEGGGDAAALPPLKSTAVGLPSFGQMAYLKAGDTQQYMYRLRGKQSAAQLRSVSALGRMEVVWKSQMGESGHLQSNAVQRKLPTPRSVEVTVLSIADQVLLETPFSLGCLVTNTSSKELHLQLRFEPQGQGGLVIDGVSGRSLGPLKPQASTQVTLTLIALEPGIQKVSGLQLFDTVSEQLHEVGPLADVFVTQRDVTCETLK
uniref:Trafficking protein particle complex subunit 13 n=1 Tax=Phaeocystis antarctica TaxID=33657 RepID=A0A7S0I231_9EUKA